MESKSNFPKSSKQTFSTPPPDIYYNGKSYLGNQIHSGDIHSTSAKNIVMCLDGTDGEFGVLPFTNVLKLFRMIDKDLTDQLCYYQPGIGADFQLNTKERNWNGTNAFKSRLEKIPRALDAMIAYTLELHVIAAYQFLCNFFSKGDRIYLIGFSRGSFIARIIAGMIERVGLLNKGLAYMSELAWDLYCDWEYAGQPSGQDSSITLSEEFKRTFSRDDVQVHFMGLWDTVNSIGILRDRLFPFSTRSSMIQHVRHAISMDERRSKFKQVTFEADQHEESDNPGIGPESSLPSCNSEEADNSSWSFVKLINMILSKPDQRLPSIPSADILEVYFAGNHSDCGGGWELDPNGESLSNIPFRWILSQAVEFGIKFKPGAIKQFSQEHTSLASFLAYDHDSLSLRRSKITEIPLKRSEGTELQLHPSKNILKPPSSYTPAAESSIVHTEDQFTLQNDIPSAPVRRFDARGGESLLQALLWWLIEFIPFGYKVQDDKGQWVKKSSPNLGKSRTISTKSSIHWSVFFRLHYVEDYLPENLPNIELGAYVYNSLSDFQKQFGKKELQAYCCGLDLEKIKTDWSSGFWRVIPDDLQSCLDERPDL